MILLDPTSAIHDLAGRSGSADSVVRFAAQDLIYIAIAALALLWIRRQGLRAGLGAGGGLLVAIVVGSVISAAWNRPRPFVGHFTPLFAHDPDASFPSDHLLALGAVTAGAWFGWRLLGGLLAIIAAVVAFARVYAGVHYIEDVLGGFAIGALCGVLVWYVLAIVMPLVDRVDAELQRRGLRPRFADGPSP